MTPSNELTLICPRCETVLPRLSLDGPRALKCAKCGTGYDFREGVHRFVPGDRYAGSFSYQWKKLTPFYFGVEAEAGAERSLRKLHITPERVRGRLVLDAGCGMGRFSEVLSRWGATCVAVDLSESIDVAYSHLRDRKNIVFVQADLNELPFPRATFDVIFSWGVLHHTENTEATFKAVVRHLKPGGTMGIFVYGKNKGFRSKMINTYRHVTRRMPRRLLYAMCALAGPLHYVYKIPVIGYVLRELFPISRQRSAQLRILETFDLYSPYYRWEHPFPEVQRWFVEAGATSVRIYDPPVNATGEFPGSKPQRPS